MDFDKRDFAAIIGALAHEQRTPLNAATGWLDLARMSQRKKGPVPEKALEGIDRAVRQHAELLNAVELTCRTILAETERYSERKSFFCEHLTRACRAERWTDRLHITGLPNPGGLMCSDDGSLEPLCHFLLQFLDNISEDGRYSMGPGPAARPDQLVLTSASPFSDLVMCQAACGVSPLREMSHRPRRLLRTWKLISHLDSVGLKLSLVSGNTVILGVSNECRSSAYERQSLDF